MCYTLTHEGYAVLCRGHGLCGHLRPDLGQCGRHRGDSGLDPEVRRITDTLNSVGKGTPTHDAAVVGDTVGDPLKDTVGPCLDIFIKIMSTVSLVAVPVFARVNLVDWLAKFF